MAPFRRAPRRPAAAGCRTGTADAWPMSQRNSVGDDKGSPAPAPDDRAAIHVRSFRVTAGSGAGHLTTTAGTHTEKEPT